MGDNFERFRSLDFEGFRQLATERGLSNHERIGFPDSYRAGFETPIFEDIVRKVTPLAGNDKVVFDVGPGCSDVSRSLIRICEERHREIVLIDSAEMLEHLPAGDRVRKVAARFPECEALLADYRGRVDAIVCYSVLHYALLDVAFYRFIDAMLHLLAPGGSCLLGDIPNLSMRRRFFASDAGSAFHKDFMKTTDAPVTPTFEFADDRFDDAVVLSILMRARAAGFHGFVLPQPASLPMANRREDILITRP